VFLLTSGLVSLLPPGSKLPSTLWGLHFILGSLLAIALRSLLRRTGRDGFVRDDMLARTSVIAVDVTTAGAIAAVRLDVLTAWLLPILVMSLLATVLTLLGCLWLARRAFPEAPFAHTLVLFGMGTGTLSTGLALLRMLDPELRGTVARNSVIGATASVPFNAPLFLLVIPIAQGLSSQGPLVALGGPLAMLVVYWLVLVLCWRWLTPLRLLRPLRALWPPVPPPAPDDPRATTH
jgi:ESS family glutamate:Na+ symporter